jgi:hypothetical protein
MDTVGDATVTTGNLGTAKFVINAVPDNGGAKAACITVATTADANLTVTHAANASIVCSGLQSIVANAQNMALKGSKIKF